MPSAKTREKVNATEPLVTLLTSGLDHVLAQEVRSEVRTAAQAIAQGVTCGRVVTGLCGRCEWVSTQTGMEEGVCQWIESQDRTTHQETAASYES